MSKILVIPGDGVGPEVMSGALQVIDWLGTHRSVDLTLEHGIAGGASLDQHGTPLTDETLATALDADAVFFGSVGGPAWDNQPFDKKPEKGLLRLRKELNLYANLRPAMVLPALTDASSLKPEKVRGLDIMILRENTGGVYFAQPRGLETLADGSQKAYDTNLYTTAEIETIGRMGLELARQRRGKLTSVEKANVMWSGVLWRDVMTALHQREGEGVELEHMYADNCAMQLVREPKQFDVIVTDNLFGDLLSDCAAMLTGSLGMLPSASLGDRDSTSLRRKALYEPVHGTAPDIAGTGVVNPLAQILSLAMMLRYSFELDAEATLLEHAVNLAVGHPDATDGSAGKGMRTKDIMAPGCTTTGTKGMVDTVLTCLDELSR